MSRLWKFVGLAAAALSVLIFVPQAASAVEGLGSHRGSFLMFPFYDNSGANITFYRISMGTDPVEVQVNGTIQLHMHYLTRNPAATSCGSHVPPCLETNRYLDFTLNDYILLNVSSHNPVFDIGWAYAYAVLRAPNQPVQRLVWDRFFSDTVYVDTAAGTAAGWTNYANIADVDWVPDFNPAFLPIDLNGNGECDYSMDIHFDEPRNSGIDYPDVCLLNFDTAGPVRFFDEFQAELFADTGMIHYFTPWKRPVPGGPPMEYTMLSATVMGWDDIWGQPFYRFSPGPEAQDACFTWNTFLYNANEVQRSGLPQSIVCHEVMDINEFTANQLQNFQYAEGFVKYWDEVGPTGDESRDVVILQWEQWSGLNNIMWALYPTHEKTTIAAPWFGMWGPSDDDRVDDQNDW